VVPSFISPDDMVTVYKNLVRETEDERTGNDKFSVTHRTSGFIDYESFKKAIIRISVLAQEKLETEANTTANEDLLKQKLQEERKEKEEKQQVKEKMLN
jgi:flagellar motility protein MotE (MotC chaperone)